MINEQETGKGGGFSIMALMVFGLTIAIWGIGGYAAYQYIVANVSPSTVGLIGSYLGTVIVFIKANLLTVLGFGGLLFLISVIGVALALFGISKFGKEVLWIITLLIPVAILAAGAFLSFVEPFSTFYLLPHLNFKFGYIPLIVGGLVFLGIFLIRGKISFAGDILEFSASGVAKENSVILLNASFSIFAIFSAVMDGLFSFWMWENVISVQTGVLGDPLVQAILVFILAVLGAWVIYSAMYITEGAIVAIIDDWYSHPEADKANALRGLKRAVWHSGALVKLGFIMGLLDTVGKYAMNAEKQAKKTKNPIYWISMVFVRIIAWIVKGLAAFVTFFTVPAIIIDNKKFIPAVKRSYKLVVNNMVDVILAQAGVGLVYGFFIFMMLIFYGFAGYTIGTYFIVPTFPGILAILPQEIIDLGLAGLSISVLTSMAFFIVGFVPAFVMMRPLQTAYKTVLYEFAIDKEQGFTRNTRLPDKIRKKFVYITEHPDQEVKRWKEPDY
ncbi:MAG: hypothetical protein ACTSUV_02775 [Candidatus Ranarchaeia archaeon]